ncbi:MAG TPA: hypothetical protein VGG35_05365, partial [Streptosporangiaceae bacterium]
MAEPAPETPADLTGRSSLLQDACRRSLDYLGGLAERPVAAGPAAVAALDGLDFELPARGLAA